MAIRAQRKFIAILILAACQPADHFPEEPAPGAPLNATQIHELVAETEDAICGLDLSGLGGGYNDDGSFSELRDFQSYAADNNAGYGAALVAVYRRAALNRRLQAGPDVTELADMLYAELDDGISAPETFEEHDRKVRFWDDQLALMQEWTDPEDDVFNIRFCIVSERGGPARAAAREYILKHLNNASELSASAMLDFASRQQFFTGPFKTQLLAPLSDIDTLDTEMVARLALLRDRETTLLDSDPKTAEAFWQARDREIDAVLAYLEKADFETPADELFTLTRLDQSVRNLLGEFIENKDHFESAEEADIAYLGPNPDAPTGLGDRMSRIDQFNTARVKQMLEGRDWFQDDLDGEGAGFYGWLLVQHADLDPEFQKQVLAMIEEKLGRPGVSAQNFGYLYDRVAVKDSRPQRYGTQGIECTDGQPGPGPLEDEDNIDEVRASIGLGPLAEYMALLAPCDF